MLSYQVSESLGNGLKLSGTNGRRASAVATPCSVDHQPQIRFVSKLQQDNLREHLGIIVNDSIG